MLGRLCVSSLFSTQQFIVLKKFCCRNIQEKFTWGWKGIIQYMQEPPEKKMSLSNSKWSDSFHFSVFWPTSFKLFNNTLTSDEQGLEWYELLLTPQCDKPCHLYRSKSHNWVISLFSECFLVNNQLCISSFATDKNKKNCVEDFSGAFLLWSRVFGTATTQYAQTRLL